MLRLPSEKSASWIRRLDNADAFGFVLAFSAVWLVCSQRDTSYHTPDLAAGGFPPPIEPGPAWTVPSTNACGRIDYGREYDGPDDVYNNKEAPDAE